MLQQRESQQHCWGEVMTSTRARAHDSSPSKNGPIFSPSHVFKAAVVSVVRRVVTVGLVLSLSLLLLTMVMVTGRRVDAMKAAA